MKGIGLSWTELGTEDGPARAGCGGGNSSMAYVPQGAKGLSK